MPNLAEAIKMQVHNSEPAQDSTKAAYSIFIGKTMGETMAEEFLVPTDVYLKSGIHIGTKFRTKYMEQFIYKTRPDGLSVLNLQKIDERLKYAANMLSNYEPDDVLIVSRRENSWKAVKKFQELTGCKAFAGRYPPGILTNPGLPTFMECKIILVTDAWPDKNAVEDGVKIGVPTIGLCDTNNQANNLDLVVPCNNKGKKALGLIFYIFAREYLKKRGQLSGPELDVPMEEFMEE